MADFLSGVLDAVRRRLPDELRELQARHQGPLIKLFAEDPAVHYELWLHRNRGRAELGLHFETRDADRNRRLLEYVVARTCTNTEKTPRATGASTPFIAGA
jgi:hypothetical protein